MTKQILDSQDWSHIIRRQMTRKEHPATPSTSGEILGLYKKYFEKAVGKKKGVKVIVLGATPELRDMALGYGCELVTVDLSLEQILKMTELMKHRNQPNEIIVRCNWLCLADILKNQNFDLIIGDGCFVNLSLRGQKELAKVCQRLLKKDGCLLIRDAVVDLKRQKKPSSFYIKKYRQRKMKFPDLYINFCLYPKDIEIWNPKTKEFLYNNFFNKIKKLYRKKILNEKEFKKLEKFMALHTSRIVLPKEDFEKLLKKYFKLLPVKQCKNLELCQTVRFYLGKPKKNFKGTK